MGDGRLRRQHAGEERAAAAALQDEPGEWYNRKDIDDGRKKAQEIYGGAGYMEFTAFPDLKPSDDPGPEDSWRRSCPTRCARRPRPARPRPWPRRSTSRCGSRKGPQYFVNRIVFTGNTTTRDNVIRREMRLVEGDVFNTEALKFSVRRLNQLGYFKHARRQREGHEGRQDAGRPNTVDVTVKLEEQNRNQLTFGAGVSQFEGVFGQLAFQTSNFLGRGESLTVSMTAGAGRRTTSWRSPSRSCSTATSPAASTSTSGRCSTSATTRRSPPAAT